MAVSSDTLVEDLSEIRTYLTTKDHLCEATVRSFLSRYDVIGDAKLVRSSSSIFQDKELLEALLDNWNGLLEPITFVKFIYAFCLIGTQVTFDHNSTLVMTAFLGSFDSFHGFLNDHLVAPASPPTGTLLQTSSIHHRTTDRSSFYFFHSQKTNRLHLLCSRKLVAQQRFLAPWIRI